MRWGKLLVLIAVIGLVAGVALEYSARRTAVALARALAPLASLTYSSAGIALDGSLRLRDPRLTLHVDGSDTDLHASSAELRGASGFWLFGRLFAPAAGGPDQLTIRTTALKFGNDEGGGALSEWTGVSNLVPFENLGCGSDALTAKDRQRMGVITGERRDEFNYRLDRSAGRLHLSTELREPGITKVRGFAEFSGFDVEHWQDLSAQTLIRLDRAGISFEDPGYLALRNQFCAQWLGSSAEDFIARHVAAVDAFLGLRGIHPSTELRGMYEKWVAHGGTFSLASLPDASWAPREIAAYPRQMLLRQLNVTTRLDDAPPIMFRLSFADPDKPMSLKPETEPVVTVFADDGDYAESVGVDADLAGEMPVKTIAAPVPAVAESAGEVPRASVVDSSAAAISAPSAISEQTGSRVDSAPESGDFRVGASGPTPPSNSTLALVWKPGVIERLPPQPAKQKNYRVVAVAGLGSVVGEDVRLLTRNGKRVVGQLKQVSAGHAVIQVRISGGEAELNVLLEQIREVRIPLRDD